MGLKRWIVRMAVAAGCLFAGVLPCENLAQADDISVVEMQVKDYSINVRKVNQNIVFQKGISIEGQSLEGMSIAQAKTWIEDYVKSRQERAITVTVFTDNEFCYNGSSFETTWSNPQLIDSISSYAPIGNFVEQYKNQKDLEAAPLDFSIDLAINEEKVKAEIQTLAAHFNIDPVNATVRRENGAFVVSSEIVGKLFDADKIAEELIAKITDFDNTDLILYDLPYDEVVPDYTAADFNFSPNPLGSYSTGNLGDQARVTNLKRSADGINGTVVYPGEEVSALELYGAMTAENGYQMAPGYEQGKQVMTIGGGICQTSTTLYNALLLAELQITERHNHSMIVTYVPPGLDAAVAPGVKDLKFRNNLNNPIYLQSYVSDGQLAVVIWGVEERPANRSVSYYHVVESCTFPDPLYDVVVDDSKVTYGVVPLSQKLTAPVETHPEVRAKSYKRVTVDGIVVEETKLNSDYYEPMKGLLYVASDCKVVNDKVQSSSSNAVYKYLGWDIYHGVFFKDGTPWNPAEADEHY